YHLELILIFPLVAGFICYYLYVAFKKDSAAQNPERLYREKGLMVYLVVCVVAFFGLMFLHIPQLYELFNVQPSPVNLCWKFYELLTTKFRFRGSRSPPARTAKSTR